MKHKFSKTQRPCGDAGFWDPFPTAEQRNQARSSRRALSESRGAIAPRLSCAAAWLGEQHREPVRADGEGGLFLGYFLLAKQKKVTRCRATPDKLIKILDSRWSRE